MKTSDFDYLLPPELIAQTPLENRDQSRLMVMKRADGSIEHRHFFELVDYLHDGDVLVFNDSRVIPARLNGRKMDTQGKVEILLLRRLGPNVWETLVKPARRVSIGTRIEISDDLFPDCRGIYVFAEVIGARENGSRIIRFSDDTRLPQLGQIPLPPYIRSPLANPERYQTVYADESGSVAAPTAGLHFTKELLEKIESKGAQCLFVTLHIGLDTFRPVHEEDPLEHKIHQEFGVINPRVADELSRAKREGRRVICVGTTSVRIVEHACKLSDPCNLAPLQDWVDLFIVPGFQFKMVEGLITNFHLPRSTLLMLVSAFAGKEPLSAAYQQAIAEKYRFYSFGDAMLVL